MLRDISNSPVIVVDEEAFETKECGVVYLDMYQDVTVEGRLVIDFGKINELIIRWEDGGSLLGIVFLEGKVGDKYLLMSESGRRFFRLNDYVEYEDCLHEEGNSFARESPAREHPTGGESISW
ncbi:hypothetical protein BJX64DRAFT_259798 [Aspergillus heterothallicus]